MISAMNRTCRLSGETFHVSQEDLEFYKRVSPIIGGKQYLIPPPTLSPTSRMKRKLSWRNERTLYRRQCNFSGAQIISTYSPESQFQVYENRAWISDAWDALDYGRDFDFTRPFFEQFQELMLAVPVCSLMHRQEEENCPYTNYVSGNKDCHYIFNASANEACFYSTYLQRSRDVSDCFFCFDCELCYECVDCSNCYGLRYSQECENCYDSEFLIGCASTKNCFACVSLKRGEFCILNQNYSKSEYYAKLEQIKSTPTWRESIRQQLSALSELTPHKYYSGMNNENFSGDHILNCKNAFECFDVTNLEDCKYCVWLHKAKDCQDCYAWGLKGELGYENHLCGDNFYRCVFCENCWNNVSNLMYCRDCYKGCENLFGCIGLAKQKYCIFNVQYSEQQYSQLAVKIVRHMQETGEWGEFFPRSLSPYGYNETVAAEYYPLAKEVAVAQGWNWRDASLPGIYGKAQISGNSFHMRANEANPEICDSIIECRQSGKNFKIGKAELELYQRLDIDLPQFCFDARHQQRLEQRNPRALRTAACSECSKELRTAYPESENKLLFCEACYRQV